MCLRLDEPEHLDVMRQSQTDVWKLGYSSINVVLDPDAQQLFSRLDLRDNEHPTVPTPNHPTSEHRESGIIPDILNIIFSGAHNST